ncbi:fibronectin type III domain-containing protein [candidate division KSB1 bacterium]|nr:fibronectin type III domain-containing protein [candidate division KSB1 bacterium]
MSLKPCYKSEIRKSRFNIILLILMLGTGHLVFPGALIVSWDANTESDLAGYKIYYGTESQNYVHVLDVGDTTRYIVDGLVEGSTYYFVVTAYDFSGNESAPSVEVASHVDNPTITINNTDDGVELIWAPVYGAVAYKIYSDVYPYFTPSSPIATVTETQFVDQNHPDDAGIGSYYIIKAVSESGEELFTFSKVGAFNVPLGRGKNLVSLPVIPSETAINDVLGKQLSGGSNSALSDKVLSWNGSKYEIAWLLEGTSSPLDGKWLTEAGDDVSPLQLVPDKSFWILIRDFHSDSLLTVVGDVTVELNRSITLSMGANFVGFSYPVEILLDDSELYEDQVVTGSTFSAGSDKILKWNENIFKSAWLFLSPNSAWNEKWLNESGSALTDISLLPGYGYVLWIKHENPNQLWTLPNPDPNL